MPLELTIHGDYEMIVLFYTTKTHVEGTLLEDVMMKLRDGSYGISLNERLIIDKKNIRTCL